MAVTTARRPGGRPQYVIIRDVGRNSQLTEEDIEHELERALEEESEMIILEPKKLGNEVAKWITVGNFLHKCSVMTGLACCGVQYFSQSKHVLIFTCGVLSISCASLYALSWKFDPCCKYQLVENVPELEQMVTGLSTPNPVVLVRRDDHRRKVLQNAVATFAGLLCASKLSDLLGRSR